jgi:2-oxo-4-hydroxy-4-carboxy-5-ureidoimidazoline decarboxylase
MSEALPRWNRLPRDEAANEILPCCGSKAWAERVVAQRPFVDRASLLAASDQAWRNLGEADWTEAFRGHPRIGETRADKPPGAQSDTRSEAWSAQEQQKATGSDDVVKIALAEGNREYERRFNRIFIVCASGKTAPEILEILKRRLQNDAATELVQAAEEQRQITHLRIKRWLGE